MTKIENKYLLNNKEYLKEIEIKQEKNEEELISYQNIKDKFYTNLIKDEKFLKNNNLFNFEKEDIIFESIRFFNNEIKGWLLLKEEDYLILHNQETTKLLIKIRIKTKSEKNIYNQINNINNKIEDLDNHVYIKDKNYNNEEYINSEIDIAVLTANPLVENIDNNIKELKSMNDFNNITNSILNVVRNSNKLINAEFLPLTINNLKKVIFHKPKILHLICKSTYITPEKIEENEQSYKFINLLFEKKDYFELELINEKKLDSIFEYKEKNFQDSENENVIIEKEENNEESREEEEENEIIKIIKSIVLVISTQLSNDVYKIFKKYNFKNIFVQHTTVADSKFISDLNERFYKDIIYQNHFNDIKASINSKINASNINYFFENAANIYLNNDTEQFCCCFHEHKYNCPFLRNMNDDLYIKKNNNKIKENINEKDISTHFNHLRYKIEHDFDSDKEIICCCGNEENQHNNINNIFLNHNENQDHKIKLGYGIDNFAQIKNIDLLPDYEKMKFIVGINELVYNLNNKIFYLNNKQLIIIYNKNNQYELNELMDIIIEYLKERINLIFNEEDENLDINPNDIENNLQTKKLKGQKFSFLNSDKSISMNSGNINESNYKFYDFEKINIKNLGDLNNINIEKKENKIYFILFECNLENDFINDFIKENSKIKSRKIVIFTNHKIERKIEKVEKMEFNFIEKEDYYIKYQREKIKNDKKQFENFINEEFAANREAKPIQSNNELNIIYEILFLFHCFKYYIQESELKMIYDIINNYLFQEKVVNLKEEFKEFQKILEIELNNLDISKTKKSSEIKNIIKKYKNKISELINTDLMPKVNKILENNNIYLYDWTDKITIINSEYEELDKLIENKEAELNNKSILSIKLTNIEKQIKTDNLNSIKKILLKTLNIIIIEINQENRRIYKKVFKNNNFRLYYDNWRVKITEQIKQKILKALFEYYCEMFNFIINRLRDEGRIFVEPFYTIKRLGELLGIKNDFVMGLYEHHKQEHFNLFYENKKDWENFFSHLLEDFSIILTKENINLCKKDSHIWESVKYFIEDLSISYYSSLKIIDINKKEFKNKIQIFKDLYQKEKTLYARLILMIWLNSQKMNKLNKLDLKIVKVNDNLSEENLLNIFSKYIIDINEEEDENEKIVDKESQIIDKSIFMKVFEYKVKYYFCLFKIKNKILNENLKNEISEIGKIFKEQNSKICEIKAYLLIAYFHLEKYNKNNNRTDKEGFYNYLMFSYYVSNSYKKDFIKIISSFNELKKKIHEEDKLNCENIKKICEEFNYDYIIDKNLEKIFNEFD